MNSLFDGLKSLVHHKSIVIDNPVCRLHYRATTVILLASSILVTAEQFFGDPINCMHKETKEMPKDFLNTYCWIHTTFSVDSSWHKSVGEEVIYPGVDNSKGFKDSKLIFHAYYQWVWFCLFLQSISFYIPHYIWKAFAGNKIKSMVLPELAAPVSEKRNEAVIRLSQYLQKSLGWNDFHFSIYFLTEVANFLNTILQMWVIDRFLGGQFTNYGMEVLSFTDWDWRIRYDPMIKVFPRMTKCTFHVTGQSGDIERFDALCILPINILNEKIYIFLWFWLYFLAVVSLFIILYRVLTIFSVKARVYSFMFEVPKDSFIKLKHLTNIMTLGDMFILTLLNKNLDKFAFTDVIDELDELVFKTPQGSLAPSLREGTVSLDSPSAPVTLIKRHPQHTCSANDNF